MTDFQERRQMDVVSIVAALTRIETNVAHLTEDQRQLKQSLDVYIVDHRGQHLEDRQLRREESDRLSKEFEKSVIEKLENTKSGRRVYLGLGATLVAGVTLDIVIRLIQGN